MRTLSQIVSTFYKKYRFDFIYDISKLFTDNIPNVIPLINNDFKRLCVTIHSGEGKRGASGITKDFYLNKTQGSLETWMKTFRPDTEARKHRAYKGETELDN